MKFEQLKLSLKKGFFALIGIALIAISGCSMPKYTVVAGTEEVPTSALPVWPGGDEIPRYRFAGVFYGEQNLKLVEEEKSTLQEVGSWLAGFFESIPDPQQLQAPQGGAVDENGVLYVADVGSAAVFVFDRRPTTEHGAQLPVWRDADRYRSLKAPIAVALGPMKQILVTDAELAEVFRFDRGGKPLGSFGAGILNRPTGLARDAARGEIYVADTQDHDIKVFDDKGVHLRTLGERGTANGQFNFPIHLSFARDSLYVVDSMNTRIQRFDANGNHLLSFGSRGRYQGQFSRPKGVAVDGAGNIYVVDSHFDHLLVYNPQGEFLLPIGGAGSQLGNFHLPAGVWSDGRDHIYVADMGNGRVIALRFLGGE